MNIQAEKLKLVKMILDVDNPNLINKVKSLLYKETDFWDTLTIEQKEDIELGIEELDNGETASMDEILKDLRK